MNEESQNPRPELKSTPPHMPVQQGSPFHEPPPAAHGVVHTPVQLADSLLLHEPPPATQVARMQVQGSENVSSKNKRDSITTTDPSAQNSPQQKRAKCVKQQPFNLLTDDRMLFPIFEFIGPYHFRFVAGVSKRWKRLYTQFQQVEYRKRVSNPEEFEKLISTTVTSTASIAESLSRAKIFLSDTRKLTSPFERIKIQENGSQEMKIVTNRPRFSIFFLSDNVAVHYGHVEILKLATANGCTCDEWTCAHAAGGGHLEVLRWARQNGCPWDESTCENAADGGHLEVLRWARENGCPWDELTCSSAAGGGHLEVLQWAKENGCPWDESTCANAADGCKLEVLRWARENGCPWDESTCENAADRGHLEVLRWARENGCPWDESTCSSAAGGGHLEVLQWARENGCPWDETTCENAAGGGHLEVLQWARANGCAWDNRTSFSAELGGHLEVVEWARENGCDWK